MRCSKGSPPLHDQNQEYKCKRQENVLWFLLPLGKIFSWHINLTQQNSGYENGNKRVILYIDSQCFFVGCVYSRDDEIKDIKSIWCESFQAPENVFY